VHSWEYGTPGMEMDFFKTEEKAIAKANQHHDSWSHHSYKRTEHYFDKEEKKWLLKDSTKCYEKENPERYRKCFLDHATVWIKRDTLNVNEDVIFSTKFSETG